MPLIDEAELGADILATFATRRGTGPAPRAADRPPAVPTDAILAERRSVRTFGPAGVDVATLTAILRDARHRTTYHFGAAAPGLTTVVAAYHVDGLGAGAYDAGLTRLGGPGDVAPFPERFADAPVLVAVCGNVGRADYAGLLVGAGAMGYAVWLSALAHGLVASVYGGPSEELTRIAQRAGPDLRHLFTVAVGRRP
jgi:hypothetical protein